MWCVCIIDDSEISHLLFCKFYQKKKTKKPKKCKQKFITCGDKAISLQTLQKKQKRPNPPAKTHSKHAPLAETQTKGPKGWGPTTLGHPRPCQPPRHDFIQSDIASCVLFFFSFFDLVLTLVHRTRVRRLSCRSFSLNAPRPTTPPPKTQHIDVSRRER